MDCMREFVKDMQGIKLVEEGAAHLFDKRVAEDRVRERVRDRVCIYIHRASNRWRRMQRVYQMRELQRIQFVRDFV